MIIIFVVTDINREDELENCYIKPDNPNPNTVYKIMTSSPYGNNRFVYCIQCNKTMGKFVNGA